MTTINKQIAHLDPCKDARVWLGLRRSWPKAWAECPRGDWMLWLLVETGADHRRLVLAACACARLSLHLVPDGEDRPRIAIEAAEAWAKGEATLVDVRAATIDAQAARATCAAARATYATYADYVAALGANDAAHYAAYAAANAAYVTDAAYFVAVAVAAAHAAVVVGATDDAARAETLRQSADIVRRHFPEHPEAPE